MCVGATYNETKPRDHPRFLSVTQVEEPPAFHSRLMLGLKIDLAESSCMRAASYQHMFFSSKAARSSASPSPLCSAGRDLSSLR